MRGLLSGLGGVRLGGLLDFLLTVGIVVKLGVVSPVSTGKKLNGDKRVLSGRHILPVCVIHDVTKLLCLWQNDENCKSNMEDIKNYYFPYVPKSNKIRMHAASDVPKVYVLRWSIFLIEFIIYFNLWTWSKTKMSEIS